MISKQAAEHQLWTLFEVGVLGSVPDGPLLRRFVARRETVVFEEILRRHGPMVWGVCTRVLRDHHDAQDAWQATFLVLSRRAPSIGTPEKLGNWLYGVAHRTARKARAIRARRRLREAQGVGLPEPIAQPNEARADVADLLDGELTLLPDRYRIPIVLCDLEGLTQPEAASRLGWPIGTVAGRLSRARALLAKRLARRGLALPAGSLGLLLTEQSATAAVPVGLLAPTTRAASLIAAGGTFPPGVIPPRITQLITEVSQPMTIKTASSVLLGLTLVSLIAALAVTSQATGPPPSPATALAPNQAPERPEALGSQINSLLQRVAPSVVSLGVGADLATSSRMGTIITPDGLIVTAGLFDAGQPLQVRLADGRRVAAQFLAKLERPGTDSSEIGLAQITEGGPWPAVEVGSADDLTDRDPLILLGSAWTGLYGAHDQPRPVQVRLGHRLARTAEQSPSRFKTTFKIAGDFGGPCFDLGGRLVGMPQGSGCLDAQSSFVKVDLLRSEWATLAGDRPALPQPVGARPVVPSPAEALAPGIQTWADSVVEIRSADRWVGLGAVVGPGLVLTKASELGAPITVILRNGVVSRARLAATDPDRDLALVRLSGSDLTDGIRPIEWADSEPPVGTLIAAVTPASFTPLTGVVSVAGRPIPAISGGLAVQVEDAAGGVAVTELIDDLNQGMWRRAPAFDLRVGDIITQVAGRPVLNRADYFEHFFAPNTGLRPQARLITGDMVDVTIRRAGIVQELRTRLCHGYTVMPNLIDTTSYRYTGFPKALATDLLTRPELCGAPVVDAQGRAIGLLIARAPMLETLVIPPDEVKASLAKMGPMRPQ